MNLSIFICGAQTIKMKILANLQFLRLCKKKNVKKIFILKKILYVLRLTINGSKETFIEQDCKYVYIRDSIAHL